MGGGGIKDVLNAWGSWLLQWGLDFSGDDIHYYTSNKFVTDNESWGQKDERSGSFATESKFQQ